MITLTGIHKSFGNVRAVDDVSIDIRAGEIFALAGESGSGKSTLAKIMTGLQRPDKGQVQSSGRVQMVFQDPQSSLDPLFTISRVLAEAFVRRNDIPKNEREEAMRAMLTQVGMEPDVLNRFPNEFSGGQRQRIAIARALLTKPDVLILDEPTSALDVLVQQQVIDLLKQVKSRFGLTYVFISHNLRVIRQFSDRIAVMRHGRIVEINSTSQVFSNPQHPYTRQLLAAAINYSDQT